MCTTSTMAVKLKKVASKLLTEEAKYVGSDHVFTQTVWSKQLETCWYVGTWARKLPWYTWVQKHVRHVGRHVSTQGTLAREHENTQDTLVREQVSTKGTWARKHAKHVGTWAGKHARHIGMWAVNTQEHLSILAETIEWHTYIVWHSKSAKRFPLANLKLWPRKELALSEVGSSGESVKASLVAQERKALTLTL